MNKEQKEQFIKARGWSQWYNPDYWVNEKTAPPNSDHTYYGMDLENAYKFETDLDFAEKELKKMGVAKGAMNAISNLTNKGKR